MLTREDTTDSKAVFSFFQVLLIEFEIAQGGTAGAMQTRSFIRECNLTQKHFQAYFPINGKKSQ